MAISNRLRAIRNAAKMRARGYKNSGNKTPNGLIIWTKKVNGVTKRKTAAGTPVNNGRTTNMNYSIEPNVETGSGSGNSWASNITNLKEARAHRAMREGMSILR